MTLPEDITLIVGGGGFIGQALIMRLLQGKGRRIVVVGRSPAPRYPLPSGVLYIAGNMQEASCMEPLLDRAVEVIDLAYGSVPKTSFEDPLLDVTDNLPASVTLQKLASRRTLRRYLLVSSGGTVYGPPQVLPINEDHATNPISPYGISKLVTEKYATFFWQMAGLPLLIARPANPYGLGQVGQNQQGFIGAAMRAVMQGGSLQVFGPRGTVRDYIYIRDLADGLVAVLDHGQPGEIFNIGTGIGHDNLNIVHALGRFLGPEFMRVPIDTQPSRPFDVGVNILDATRLRAIAGWAPRYSLERGLQETWSYLQGSQRASEPLVHP